MTVFAKKFGKIRLIKNVLLFFLSVKAGFPIFLLLVSVYYLFTIHSKCFYDAAVFGFIKVVVRVFFFDLSTCFGRN